MSRFSEQCKELIRENGTNVYRMSKEFSLEVTALQRMVTGKRLPNNSVNACASQKPKKARCLNYIRSNK